MDWSKGYNEIFAYIETHLKDDISYEAIADILGYSEYHVKRLFLLLSGTSLPEYIRKRRLAEAASDLQSGDVKAIDVGMTYGYSTPGSFNKAFKAMHGVNPIEAKEIGTPVKAYPPLTFEISGKGPAELQYHIEEREAFRVVGYCLPTTIENGACYQEIPAFWQQINATGKQFDVLALMDQEPMGLLGVSDYDPDAEHSEFNYYIACASSQAVPEGMVEFVVPKSTWAMFQCESIETLGPTQQRIVMEWLPNSAYEFGHAPDVEVYPADNKPLSWLPVKRKKD